MSALIQDLSCQLSHERGDVQLVIANPSAFFESERELTYRVSREQVRELAAAFAEIDRELDAREAEQRAREAGMTFSERVALKIQRARQAKAQQEAA
jgi:hypothetical protein